MGVTEKQGRYPILDALRCVLALWVTVGHLGVFPLFAGLDSTTTLGRYLVRGWQTTVWGVPAVIGFFVISGFCIHLPFRRVGKLPLGRYYGRRYTRILLPVVAAILFNEAIGNRQVLVGPDSVLWNSVLWSLFCEEIYYAAYPLARVVRGRFGWKALLVPAFLLATVTGLVYPDALDGSILGACKTAVILFPIWLLGCLLAEQSERLLAPGPLQSIWKWRFRAWAGSWLAEMLHFHAHVSLELAMLGFGVLAYFWIRQELAHATCHKPYPVLAWAGLWSYSLYLMHLPAFEILARLHPPSLGYLLDWFLMQGLALSVAYAFYLCIERPSHRAARKIRVTVADSRAAASVVSRAPESTAAPA